MGVAAAHIKGLSPLLCVFLECEDAEEVREKKDTTKTRFKSNKRNRIRRERRELLDYSSRNNAEKSGKP